jgi:DNA-dependent protein kinase catalytic subunit
MCQLIKKFILSTVDSGSLRPISNLRRRFLRHSYQNKIFHASREIQRSDRKQEVQQERSRRLEADITPYREYRSGDFPDIEIPYSAIIGGLQILAKV